MSVIILNNCTGCGACIARCPLSALTLETELPDGFGSKRAVVDIDCCRHCGDCLSACRYQAIILKS